MLTPAHAKTNSNLVVFLLAGMDCNRHDAGHGCLKSTTGVPLCWLMMDEWQSNRQDGTTVATAYDRRFIIVDRANPYVNDEDLV
jgi:hypothetical protein